MHKLATEGQAAVAQWRSISPRRTEDDSDGQRYVPHSCPGNPPAPNRTPRVSDAGPGQAHRVGEPGDGGGVAHRRDGEVGVPAFKLTPRRQGPWRASAGEGHGEHHARRPRALVATTARAGPSACWRQYRRPKPPQERRRRKPQGRRSQGPMRNRQPRKRRGRSLGASGLGCNVGAAVSRHPQAYLVASTVNVTRRSPVGTAKPEPGAWGSRSAMSTPAPPPAGSANRRSSDSP